MKKFSKVLWGLVFIVLGIILGLNSLEITNINLLFDGWWTLFIIVPCFINLFKDNDKTGDIIGIVIGVLLLLACQDIIKFEYIFKLSLPIVLVIIGLSFIFKDVIGSKIKDEISKLNKENPEKKEHCATFGNVITDFSNEEFKGCDLSAVFGGVKCDLRKSIIKKDVVINASTIFGGIELLIPQGVNVKISSTGIFGGVDDENITNDSSNERTIYINATCIFGGIEIK